MPSDPPILPESGVVTLPETAWREARRRAEVIVPLAASARLGQTAVDRAATAHWAYRVARFIPGCASIARAKVS